MLPYGTNKYNGVVGSSIFFPVDFLSGVAVDYWLNL
jgi:hypothetical protein